jgi:beta-lactamase class D
MMTVKQALYLIQVQLQKNPQNKEAIQVIKDAIPLEKKTNWKVVGNAIIYKGDNQPD